MKPIRSILVATDLGEASEAVPRAAAALAALTSAELHVLHALDIEVAPYVPLMREMTFVDPVAAAERLLDEQIRRAIPPGVRVATRRVEIHPAHQAIGERAAEVGADLIVLGAHRQRGVADGFLGGTADRVIRASEICCLLIRSPLSLPLRRVAVPFDLSDPARGALELALAWAAAFGPGDAVGRADATVTVAHVVPNVFRAPDFEFDDEVIEPELRREVARAVARVEEAGDVPVRVEVAWGDAPADGVLEFVKADRSDLVVVATHGYGAVRRALIGSVASRIARGAPCPVLLVPPALWEHRTRDGLDEGAVPPFGP